MNLSPSKRPACRFLGLLLVSAVALLVGCSRKTAQDVSLDSAIKRYDRVKAGMSKQEVVALLGEPANRKESVYRWEAVGRHPNNASIDVKFNGAEQVASIARTQARD